MSNRNNIIKLPGLADIHVHLREPGNTQKEDFFTGTQAAVAGGYTQVVDMPNNDPPTTDIKRLEEKEKLAKSKIWCDVGFHFGATASSTQYFKKIATKAFSIKVYMNQTTGPLLIDKLEDRDTIFRAWPGPLPIMVHAEGKTVETAIKLAKKYNKKIHVCHLTADQISTVKAAKKEKIKITTEVTPHHLFLNKTDAKELGPFSAVKPQLLPKKDQQSLWKHLELVDVIATDHAPHTVDEKNDKSSPKFGLTGLETTLPLMFEAVAKGMISTDKLIEMTSTNPRRIFSLPAQNDTFVLVDFSKTFKISKEKLFTKSKWTPFEGITGRGEIKKVVINGRVVFQDGDFIGRPSGKVISLEISKD